MTSERLFGETKKQKELLKEENKKIDHPRVMRNYRTLERKKQKWYWLISISCIEFQTTRVRWWPPHSFFFLTFCYLFSTFKVFLIMLLFIFPVYSRAYPPHKAEQPLTNAGQIVISNGRLLLQANYISRNSETYLISYHKILIFSAFFFSFLYPGIQMQSLPKINVSFVIPNGLCDPTKPHQKVEEK